MPTPGGTARINTQGGLEIDHDWVPAGHYRGRGGDQAETGPAGSWLREDAGRFEENPAAAAPKTPDSRTDAEIEARVRDALRDHGDIDEPSIEVAVSEGEVTLGGTVRSRHGRFLAENMASAVPGVVGIRNAIEIDESRGSPSTETSNPLYASTAVEGRK